MEQVFVQLVVSWSSGLSWCYCYCHCCSEGGIIVSYGYKGLVFAIMFCDEAFCIIGNGTFLFFEVNCTERLVRFWGLACAGAFGIGVL